jgi:hypothetical protein
MLKLKGLVSLFFVIAIVLSPNYAIVGMIWMGTLMVINAVSMRMSGAILKRRIAAMGLDFALMGEGAREAGYSGHIFVIIAVAMAVGIVVYNIRNRKVNAGWILVGALTLFACIALC